MFRIIKKPSTKKQKVLTYTIGILIAALIIFFLILSLGNGLQNSIDIIFSIFKGLKMYKNVFNIFVPLALAALGLAISYKMKFYNIGGEGQIIMGAIVAECVARIMTTQNNYFVLLVMFLGAIIAGGLYSLISGLLKIYFKANEVIITLMLNYIALVLARILQSTYWKEGQFVQVAPLNDNARLANLSLSHQLLFFLVLIFVYNVYRYLKENKVALKTGIYSKIKIVLPILIMVGFLIIVYFSIGNKILISTGILVLLLVYLIIDIFMNYTRTGFEITVIGESPKTAIYSGMNINKTTILVTALSGMILGLTGFVKLAGINHQFSPDITFGLGFTAVIIAWLADLKPTVILLVAFGYSLIYQGIKFVEPLGVNTSVCDIILAIILFTALTCEFFNRYKIVGGKKNAKC